MTAWQGAVAGGVGAMPVHDLHLASTRQPGAAPSASSNSPTAAGRVNRVEGDTMLGIPFPEFAMRVLAARWPAVDSSPAPGLGRSAGWPATTESRIGSAAARSAPAA